MEPCAFSIATDGSLALGTMFPFAAVIFQLLFMILSMRSGPVKRTQILPHERRAHKRIAFAGRHKGISPDNL